MCATCLDSKAPIVYYSDLSIWEGGTTAQYPWHVVDGMGQVSGMGIDGFPIGTHGIRHGAGWQQAQAQTHAEDATAQVRTERKSVQLAAFLMSSVLFQAPVAHQAQAEAPKISVDIKLMF